MMTVDYQPNQTADVPKVSQRPCLDLTVVIPTYNGAERIPQVLDALKIQQDMDGIRWEVIVCDNNSCDRTVNIVLDYQHTWLQDVPLRYCFVAEQGAAFARQRGVVEASGHIVAFLDDDNIPTRNWLSNVHRFAQAYPKAGAFGSQIHGEFHGELPEGFEHIACFLAIVERGNQPHLYQPKSKILPPAAGLAVRRSAWLKVVPERLFLNHKGKSAGLASEDLEALLHIQRAGWEIWYNSDMVVTHQIPDSRLTREYLISLLRCVGLSRFYIRFLGAKDWQKLFKVPAYIANDLRKLALHYMKNGLQQCDLDIVAACERSLLTNTVVSPGFLMRKAFQDFWQNQRDNKQLPERQQWLRRLTDAFEGKQLDLYQQAVVCLDSSQSVNLDNTVLSQIEILLRLRQKSPDLPPISPAQFFPTAERYGLMRTLDRRVIQQVCQTLEGRSLEAAYSLNLSAASVCDPSFPVFLEDQLRRYCVNPENIYFEISESVMMDSLSEVAVLIGRIKPLGLRVIIDEIGYVAESLDYMAQLPIDCLKLSKELISQPKRSSLALSNWIKFSRQRGIQLVAKGVETQAEVDYLKSLGIDYLQGYYLSEPFSFT